SIGRAVLAELRSDLRLDGKTADARRLRAICRIDPAVGAPLCRQALAEGNAILRAEALVRLAEVGEPGEAEKTALAACGDKNRAVRAAALEALAAAKNDEALEKLFEGLQDKDESVIQAATIGLGGIRHPQATERLFKQLQDTLAALDGAEPKKGKGSKKAAAPKDADGNPLRQAQALVGALGRRTDGNRQAVVQALVPLIQKADQYLWPT